MAGGFVRPYRKVFTFPVRSSHEQPMNKEVYTQTMLMARHQKIAKLFDENFWVTR